MADHINKKTGNGDVQYVDCQSTLLDFKIMFKTVSVMLKKEGINAPDQAVGASRFNGTDSKISSD